MTEPTTPSSAAPAPPSRRFGAARVFPVGLGTMPLSFERMLPHRDRALATVHAALDAGVTHLDTARIYSPSWDRVGHNEELVAEALRTWSGDASTVQVASKGGIVLGPDGGSRDASRDTMHRTCEASLASLGRDVVDVYYLHRADPSLTWVEQVESLLSLREAGLAREVALSNVTPEMLEVALDVAGGPDDGGVVAVQNEYSPRFREHPSVIQACAERGIAFVPWSPFGGADRAQEVGSRYGAFVEVAQEHDVTPHQVALAWHLHLSPTVVPIPGCSRPGTATDSAAAAGIVLSDEEVSRLSATEPEGSSQYPDDEPAPALR